MDQHYAMLGKIVFLLFLFIQMVFTRTSNFKLERDKPLYLSKYLYLTNTDCKTAVQCAAECLSTHGCGLVDLDSGNLYKRSNTHGLVTQRVINYIEPLMANATERRGEGGDELSFLMVAKYGRQDKPRDIYKVSLPSNLTERTGITVDEMVISIIYDKASNTLYWSHASGIFKQAMEPHSKREQTSKDRTAYYLHLHNETLFYSKNVGEKGFIYKHAITRKDSKELWHQTDEIKHFVVESSVACWVRKVVSNSIHCHKISSKKNIFNHSTSKRVYQIDDMALLKVDNFSWLLFVEFDEEVKYPVKAFQIFTSGYIMKGPKHIRTFKETRNIFIVNSLLFFSFQHSKEINVDINIKIGEINQNGNIDGKEFLTYFPILERKSGIHVIFLG